MPKRKRKVRTDGYTVYPDISKTKLGNFLILTFIFLGLGIVLLKQFAPNTYRDLENKVTHFISGKTVEVAKPNTVASVEEGQVSTEELLGYITSMPQSDKTMYVTVNNNVPYFTQEDISLDSEVNKANRALFEERQSPSGMDYYEMNKAGFQRDKFAWELLSELDSKNRVGQANAMLSKEVMSKDERKQLRVNPSGWKQAKTKSGSEIFDRSHLIGHQFTGHNNELRNLMTGTGDFNKRNGMLQFEEQVANALHKGIHVRYRITPLFYGDELIARGVQMEAYSVEDRGASVQFNVIIRNIIKESGYTIDYTTSKVVSE